METQLGAMFDDHAAAEAAVAELRSRGLGDEHLGVAVHAEDGYVLEQDTRTEVRHGVERGVAVGAPLGAIAGMTVLALIVPGVGTLGVGGILAAGGISGAVAGTYFGGLLGLAAEDHVMEDERNWQRIPLQPGQTLVVVSGHDRPDEVAGILRSHGGRIVGKPSHVR